MSRLANLRDLMRQNLIDAMLVTDPHNRPYLSGFTGSNGVLIITPDKQALATDSRYYEQVRQQCPNWELIEVGYNFTAEMIGIFSEFGLGGRNIAFEAHNISADMLNKWEQTLQGRVQLVSTTGLVESLRMVKDANEIAAIKKAVALADEAFAHIVQWVKPGMREKDVAWELESYMRTHGASAMSFPPIVASGPNSALPHAHPTDRLLQAGEVLLMDFGCVVDNYCSDITRTVCLGEPADEKYITLWNTVLNAQQTVEETAKANMTGQVVDAIARDIIQAAGYGKEYFGHGLGHGVGLDIHESPRYSFAYPHTVMANAILTVEPGIYMPGWGGIRIEDMVLVKEDSLEVLTQAPKMPIIDV